MRARSKKLLSGASALAVMASLGVVSPALAAQTLSGPGTYAPYVNAQTDSVTINLNATVDRDATTNDSFFNNLAMNAAGANLTINDSLLLGDIFNSGSMISTGGVAIDILNDAQIDGELFNAGSIGGATFGISIVDASTIGEGIENTGSITGGTAGILLGNDSEIFRGILNTGHIGGGIGVHVNDAEAELRGGIFNSGSGSEIVGTANAAIQITTGLVFDGITNDGLIQGQGAADGIRMLAGTFTGNITNNTTGIIEVTGSTNVALLISGGTFNGNITNSGQILGEVTAALGIVISGATAFTGNIVNNTGAVISADATAVQISNATYVGNVTNAGQITSGTTDAVVISAAAFTGTVTNEASGVITGASNGLRLSGTAFTGNVVNHGNIVANGSDGISAGATTMTGGVTNTGVISGANDGIEVVNAATITGAIANSGTIIGDTNANASGAGINVGGQVQGGIANSGTIRSTVAGIDLTAADAAHTLTQTAGLIQGNNGAVTDALRLANTYADTFNGNGGTLDGDIVGGVGDGDDVIMAPSGTFAYLRGTASDLDRFDMSGSGAAILGSSARGAIGAGVAVNAASMTHGGEGTLYIDDDTNVNLTGAYTQTDGTLEFQLTSSTLPADFGHITAASAALGGRIAAYVQGDTFASVGGNTFVYQNVVAGTVAGTFVNAGAIDVNSIFFEGKAIVNAADVDIWLTRQSFVDALALPGLTQNQMAVGGALETIYNNGGFGSDFEDLYNYLLSLGAGHEEEVAHIYDELGGAEHADLQEIGLRVSHGFTDLIGERLDDMKSAGHTATASLGLRRYAEAAAATASDAAPVALSSHGMRGSMGMSVWGRGYGAWTESDGDAEAAAYDQDTGGFAGGVDFAVDGTWNVGGAIGWSSTDVEFATAGDEADVDSFQFAAFAAFESGQLYGDAVLDFGFHDITSTRQLELGVGTEIATAAYDANTWGLHGELGGMFDAGRVDVQPFVGVAYLSNATDGFAESGASDFNLLVGDADADSLTSTVGLRLSGSWKAGGVRLIPDAEIAWRHEFLDERQTFTAAFIEDPGTQFQIVSSELAPDSVLASAGLGAQVSKNLVLFIDYNGVYNNAANTHAASAGLRATW